MKNTSNVGRRYSFKLTGVSEVLVAVSQTPEFTELIKVDQPTKGDYRASFVGLCRIDLVVYKSWNTNSLHNNQSPALLLVENCPNRMSVRQIHSLLFEQVVQKILCVL